MLQRTILRQRRVVSSSLSRSAYPPSSALRQTSPFQQLYSKQASLRAIPRYYSTENGANKEDAKKENDDAASKEAETPEDLLKELEAKNKEVVDLKDKYLRSVADFRNLQERTKRDMENARTFAIQKFAVDLLESIDNFDRALSVVPGDKLTAEQTEANKDLQELHQGLKMTENILMGTLKKHGLERFDPLETVDGASQKFDPKLHEATFMAKMEGKENGDIMFVQSKGYSLNGRVLRAAKVGVVKND